MRSRLCGPAGRPVTDVSSHSGTAKPDLVLEARGLSRHFRVGGLRGHTLHAVDDVDLGIAEREIVALVGESGSGKSTVARLLAMVYRPTSGEILFRGRPVSIAPPPPPALGLPGRGPDGLPGPVQLAQPRSHHRLRPAAWPQAAPARPRPGRAPIRGGTRAGGRRPGPAGLHHGQVPLRAFGRPAPARRFRPGPLVPAETGARRRTGFHVGRLDPNRPAQRDGPPAGGGGGLDPVHNPRHRLRPLRLRPGAGHVRRPPGRAGPRPTTCCTIPCTPIPACCFRRCPTRGRRCRSPLPTWASPPE